MAILNNIKNVLSEKGVMSKWLAKQLQKDPATVSKWCNNHSQPDLYTFVRIANCLMLMFMNLFVIQKNSI
nr:helix-turn-helix transcriptional regulator [Bacteroides sp. D20]